MNKPTGMACATLLLCASGALRAADGFAGVQCGSDVPKALLGRTMPNERVAVLQGNEGKDVLPATAAWRIDEAGKRFVKVPAEGLLCARDGVITADGGR